MREYNVNESILISSYGLLCNMPCYSHKCVEKRAHLTALPYISPPEPALMMKTAVSCPALQGHYTSEHEKYVVPAMLKTDHKSTQMNR